MLVVAVVCICWTSWLIILTLAPNQTANYVMDTGEFDDGQFWLIPEELSVLQIVSVAGLAVVVALYSYVLLKMLVWREYHHVEGSFVDRVLMRCEPSRTLSDDWSKLDLLHRAYRLIWELYLFLKELTGFRGRHRKLWNLCLKALDLMLQAFMVSKLLEAGTPVQLTLGFAVFTALNSLFCAVEIISHRYTAFAEILIDSLFDLCAAVVFPIAVLLYSAHNFDFDRAVFRINMELLPVGSFERRARMLANPTEIELFRVSFDSLRIRTLSDFFLRIGMNIGFAYRFKRVVEVLIQMQTQRQRQQATKRGSQVDQHSTLLKFPKVVGGKRSCQRAAPKSLAILFLAYSVGVVVVTQEAISTSQSVCAPFPECVVFAYRWRDTPYCPCRALIDGDRAPKTYYEWTHPADATNTVKALASAGTLETLQLINRQLTVLPDELRGCRDLNFIQLINCATEELPTWAKDLRMLQYLQIEGKVGSNNLGTLADDLFSDMPKLRYLQLGLHQRMVRLPALDGVPNLSCLILSRMSAFTELPSFKKLPRLQRLEFSVLKHLSWIPDLGRSCTLQCTKERPCVAMGFSELVT
ncbi:hypothetical protein PR001_g4946 [Phytophthora rubi]|uniref:Leucine-rich repeat domain, L domain-like n=1 Tax=Phytophthora rubi TaxID=129364 RepID=A0A6A3NVH0_9STRA|nr:hypothetical protein PR002_g5589 [Phytophthora rubi]KAE9045502.1 hypothetical protein PR001_g4946 [Phytophthora rubi]